MTEEVTKVLQDYEGNEYPEIDSLRAVEGMVSDSPNKGIVEVQSASTGSVITAYSRPTHATELYVSEIEAFNSVGSGHNTYTLYDVSMNSSGSIVSSTQRSVPINVGSGNTSKYSYSGAKFDNSVGLSSEFQGQFGVAVISDHHRDDEPAESI